MTCWKLRGMVVRDWRLEIVGMVEELGWSNRVSAFLARIETRREDYTVRIDSTASDELPHRKSNFVKDRCLKKDVTLRWCESAIGGAYDESTKQTRAA
jgi:hypothetical protein